MTSKILHSLSIVVLALAILSVSTSPTPTHFGDASQNENDNNMPDSASLTPLQLEMLVQRLSEYNNQLPPLPLGWERLVRAPEVKRQSRYRQCYFNPISCFRK